MGKKRWKIPCAGCGKTIKVGSLRHWYCKKCLKQRNNNSAIERYKNNTVSCEVGRR